MCLRSEGRCAPLLLCWSAEQSMRDPLGPRPTCRSAAEAPILQRAGHLIALVRCCRRASSTSRAARWCSRTTASSASTSSTRCGKRTESRSTRRGPRLAPCSPLLAPCSCLPQRKSRSIVGPDVAWLFAAVCNTCNLRAGDGAADDLDRKGGHHDDAQGAHERARGRESALRPVRACNVLQQRNLCCPLQDANEGACCRARTPPSCSSCACTADRLGQLCRYDDLAALEDNIELQTTILSRFDLIFIVKDQRIRERDAMIANHVLGIHRQGGNPNPEGAQHAPDLLVSCSSVAQVRRRNKC
jgi:MCM P-loop domain